MFGIHDFGLFLAAGILLNLAPGPDTVYILGRSFLAFLPQFIDASTQAKMAAFLILGLTFVTTGTIWCLALAWFAAGFSARFRGNPTVATVLNRIVGSLFVFLGLRLAFAARR